MKEYTVMGTVTCTVGITVIANNEDEAKEKASEEFGGIMAFAGNGGTDKIIGVYGEKEFVQCDDDLEWDYVDEGEEVEAEENDEDEGDDL